jgi:membrane associated rhomboid family serine protease
MSDESHQTRDESGDDAPGDKEESAKERAPAEQVASEVDFVGTASRGGADAPDQADGDAGDDEGGAELIGITTEGEGREDMPSSSDSVWDQWQQRPQPAPSGPIDQLKMSPPTFLTRGVVIPGIALLAGAIFYGGQILELFTADYTPMWLRIVIAAIPATYLLYAAYRGYIYPGERQAVRFEEDAVVLPKSSNSKLDDTAAYEDIQAVLAVARGPIQSVIIDFGHGTAMYSSRDFEREDAPALLRRELMRRIKQLPNAPDVLDRLEEQEQRSRELSQRSNRATMAMLGVVALAFGLQHYVGALDTTLGMVRWGAAAPPLIDDGQYFRLVAANLFHAGWVHLLLNGVALFFLGTVVEKISDKWTLVFVTLFSGVFGVATSWMLTSPWPFSIGSSAAIFGLFGAFAVLHLKYGKNLPALYRQSTTWWVVIIVLNAGLSFGIEMVDEWAHMGGMAAGALAMWVALLPRPDFDSVDRAPGWVKAAAGVMIAIFVAGVAWTGSYAATSHPEDLTAMYEALVERAETGEMEPLQVNNVAFKEAIAEDVSAEHLRLLEEATESVISDEKEQPQIVDTLATIRYRLGTMTDDPDEKKALFRSAITEQLDVLGESSRPSAKTVIRETGPTFATQLARFLDAHRRDFGVWRRAEADNQVSMEFVPKGDGTLEIEWDRSVDKTVRVLAVAKSDGELEGLVQVCFPKGKESLALEDDDLAGWPNNQRLFPAYIDDNHEECVDGLDYWSAVDEVATYP